MAKKKKYLKKNEFRMDLNPAHKGKGMKPHPAYISARYKHKYLANTITHSQFTNGVKNYDIIENPNLVSDDARKIRVSPPFWQSETQFGKDKLTNFKFSKLARRRIARYNRKFKK